MPLSLVGATLILLAMRPSLKDTRFVLLVSAVSSVVLLVVGLVTLVDALRKLVRDLSGQQSWAGRIPGVGARAEAVVVGRVVVTAIISIVMSLSCLLLALPLLKNVASIQFEAHRDPGPPSIRLSRLWLVWRAGNTAFTLFHLCFLITSYVLDSSAYSEGYTAVAFLPGDYYRLPEERASMTLTAVTCMLCACLPTRRIRLHFLLLWLRSERASPTAIHGSTTWLQVSLPHSLSATTLAQTNVNAAKADEDGTGVALSNFLAQTPAAVTAEVEWQERPLGLAEEVEIAPDPPIVGFGGFGIIFAARWRGQNVAAKQLRPSVSVNETTLRLFQREADLLTSLESHPHLCACIGSCLIEVDGVKRPSIILQLYEGGALENALGIGSTTPSELSSSPVAPTSAMHSQHGPSSSIAVPLRRFDARWRLGVQLASALAHLHNHQILHRDIKPANVLLDTGMCQAVLCDFGIARRIVSDSLSDHDVNGTWRYMAPETVWEQYTTAGDVYSFALLLWSLAYAQQPYHELRNGLQILFLLNSQPHTRPPLSPPPRIDGDLEASHSVEVGTDRWEEITAMLQDCWHSDAARRPTMKDVSTWLSNSSTEREDADEDAS